MYQEQTTLSFVAEDKATSTINSLIDVVDKLQTASMAASLGLNGLDKATKLYTASTAGITNNVNRVTKALSESNSVVGSLYKNITSFASDTGDKFKQVVSPFAKVNTTLTDTDKSFKSIQKTLGKLKEDVVDKDTLKKLQEALTKIKESSEKTGKVFKEFLKDNKDLDKFTAKYAKFNKELEATEKAITDQLTKSGAVSSSKTLSKQDVALRRQLRDSITDLSKQTDLLTDSTQLYVNSNRKLATEIVETTTKGVKLHKVLWGIQEQLDGVATIAYTAKGFTILQDGLLKLEQQANGTTNALELMAGLGYDTSFVDKIKTMGSGFRATLETISNPEQIKRFGMEATASLYQFEAMMQNLANLDPSLTGTKLLEQGKEIQRIVSEELKNTVTSAEAINAQYQAMSAGFTDASDASQVMSASLKLSTSVGADAATTMNMLTMTMEAYNLSADKSADTAAKLNEIVKQGVTTIPELANYFGQVAGMASAAGIQLDELSGIFATLTKTRGTARVATEIQSLVGEVLGGGIKGLTVNDIQEQGNLIDALRKKFKELGGSYEKLNQTFGTDTAARAATTLLKTSEADIEKTISAITNATKSKLEEMFNIKIDNDKLLKFQSILNKISEMMIKVGRSTAPLFEKGLAMIEKYVDRFVEFNDTHPKILPNVVKLSLVLTGLSKSLDIVIKTATGLLTTWLGFRFVTGRLFLDIGKVIEAFTKYNFAQDASMSLSQKAFAVIGQLIGFNSLEKKSWDSKTTAIKNQNQEYQKGMLLADKSTKDAKRGFLDREKQLRREMKHWLELGYTRDEVSKRAKQARRESLRDYNRELDAINKTKKALEDKNEALKNAGKNTKGLFALNDFATKTYQLLTKPIKLSNPFIPIGKYIEEKKGAFKLGTLFGLSSIETDLKKVGSSLGKNILNPLKSIGGAGLKLGKNLLTAFGPMLAGGAVTIGIGLVTAAFAKIITHLVNIHVKHTKWIDQLNGIEEEVFSISRLWKDFNNAFGGTLEKTIKWSKMIISFTPILQEVQRNLNMIIDGVNHLYRTFIKYQETNLLTTLENTIKGLRSEIESVTQMGDTQRKQLGDSSKGWKTISDLIHKAKGDTEQITMLTDEYKRQLTEIYELQKKNREEQLKKAETALNIANEKKKELDKERADALAAFKQNNTPETLDAYMKTAQRSDDINKQQAEAQKNVDQIKALQEQADKYKKDQEELIDLSASIAQRQQEYHKANGKLNELALNKQKETTEKFKDNTKTLNDYIKKYGGADGLSQKNDEINKLEQELIEQGDKLTKKQQDDKRARIRELQKEITQYKDSLKNFDASLQNSLNGVAENLEKGYIDAEEALRQFDEMMKGVDKSLFNKEQLEQILQARTTLILSANKELADQLALDNERIAAEAENPLLYSLEKMKEYRQNAIKQAKLAVDQQLTILDDLKAAGKDTTIQEKNVVLAQAKYDKEVAAGALEDIAQASAEKVSIWEHENAIYELILANRLTANIETRKQLRDNNLKMAEDDLRILQEQLDYAVENGGTTEAIDKMQRAVIEQEAKLKDIRLRNRDEEQTEEIQRIQDRYKQEELILAIKLKQRKATEEEVEDAKLIGEQQSLLTQIKYLQNDILLMKQNGVDTTQAENQLLEAQLQLIENNNAYIFNQYEKRLTILRDAQTKLALSSDEKVQNVQLELSYIELITSELTKQKELNEQITSFIDNLSQDILSMTGSESERVGMMAEIEDQRLKALKRNYELEKQITEQVRAQADLKYEMDKLSAQNTLEQEKLQYEQAVLELERAKQTGTKRDVIDAENRVKQSELGLKSAIYQVDYLDNSRKLDIQGRDREDKMRRFQYENEQIDIKLANTQSEKEKMRLRGEKERLQERATREAAREMGVEITPIDEIKESADKQIDAIKESAIDSAEAISNSIVEANTKSEEILTQLNKNIVSKFNTTNQLLTSLVTGEPYNPSASSSDKEGMILSKTSKGDVEKHKIAKDAEGRSDRKTDNPVNNIAKTKPTNKKESAFMYFETAEGEHRLYTRGNGLYNNQEKPLRIGGEKDLEKYVTIKRPDFRDAKGRGLRNQLDSIRGKGHESTHRINHSTIDTNIGELKLEAHITVNTKTDSNAEDIGRSINEQLYAVLNTVKTKQNITKTN